MKTENESEFDKKNVWGGKNKSIDTEQKDTDVTLSDGKDFLEPILVKAGDTRVSVNGMPLMVDFRIISEANYQFIMSENERLKKEIEASNLQNMLRKDPLI